MKRKRKPAKPRRLREIERMVISAIERERFVVRSSSSELEYDWLSEAVWLLDYIEKLREGKAK